MPRAEGVSFLCIPTSPVFARYSGYILKHQSCHDLVLRTLTSVFVVCTFISFLGLLWAALVPVHQVLVTIAHKAPRRKYWSCFLRTCMAVLSSIMCLSCFEISALKRTSAFSLIAVLQSLIVVGVSRHGTLTTLMGG